MSNVKLLKLSPSNPGSALNRSINADDSLTTLPLAINYRWAKASQMIAEGYIRIEECDVFGEKLNYAFYGRPAFRPNAPTNNTNNRLFYPVCFLIDPSKFNTASVFPFDTGAFFEGLYAEHYIPSEYSIDEFSIIPDISRVKGYVHLVYDRNANYLFQHPCIRSDPRRFLDTMNAVVSLANYSGDNALDSRAGTIEFISRSDIKIEDAVIAIICPRSFTETVAVKEKMKKLRRKGIAIRTYFDGGGSPNGYIDVISQEAYRYYEKKKYVTEW